MIRRLNLTEGQAYTGVIALALAVVLAVTGIPAVLRTRAVPAGATGNRLNPRVEVASGVTPTTTSSAAVAPVPGVVARPARTVIAPVGGPVTPPALPPAITGAPTAAPALLTITTFARVDPPGAPGGLAVAPDGTIYVPTDNGTARGDRGASHIFSFDAHGHQTADRTIGGQPSEHVHGLTGAAVDSTGAIAVLEPDEARVLRIDVASGDQGVLTEIPDLPACLVSLGASPCQQGTDDRKPFPTAAAYDGKGNLFITDPAQDTVWRLRPGAQLPDVWYQSTSFTVGDGPYGLALSDGAVEFTVGTSIDPSALGGGALYRVAVNGDGTAGAVTTVALFPRGDEPGPLALGSSGTAYIVLRSVGAIVAIAPGGAESWRITAPGQGPIPLDTPSALTLIAGQLLVANEGSGTDSAHWAVLAVSVNDGRTQ